MPTQERNLPISTISVNSRLINSPEKSTIATRNQELAARVQSRELKNVQSLVLFASDASFPTPSLCPGRSSPRSRAASILRDTPRAFPMSTHLTTIAIVM